MTEKFNNTAFQIFKSIRKDMPKPAARIASKKDKQRKKDIKQGRKPWQSYE
jgi:hypothetical protein